MDGQHIELSSKINLVRNAATCQQIGTVIMLYHSTESWDTARKNLSRDVENTDMDTDMDVDNQGRGKRQRKAPQRYDPSTLVEPTPSSDNDDEDEASMLLERCSSLPSILGTFQVKDFQ